MRAGETCGQGSPCSHLVSPGGAGLADLCGLCVAGTMGSGVAFYRNGSSLTLCAPQITFIDQQLLNQKLYHSLFRLFFPSLHLWGIGLAKANVLIKQLGNHCYRLLCKSRV